MAKTVTGLSQTPVDAVARYSEYINQRTYGRVHNLQVDFEGPRVLLRGNTGSYYAKQLALTAALELADGLGQTVENEIEVGCDRPRRP